MEDLTVASENRSEGCFAIADDQNTLDTFN